MSAHIKNVVVWLITLLKIKRTPGNVRVSWSATVKGDVSIGDYTYIGGRSEIRAIISAVHIGRYCSIGRGVKIFSSGQRHRSNGISTYPFFTIDRDLNRLDFNVITADTWIGNDVWIGSNAIVMAGVRIGDGVVVGAGAIVTKDINDYAIVAGVPARVMAYRFGPEKIEYLKSEKWWQYDYSTIKRRYGKYITSNVPF